MNGTQLRQKRTELNMTQAELGKALGGVTGNTIARWERDEMAIPPYLELALKAVPKKRSSKG